MKYEDHFFQWITIIPVKIKKDCWIYKEQINKLYIKLFKVNDRNAIDTPLNRRRHWRFSGIFIINFEHISHVFLVFLLLTWNK